MSKKYLVTAALPYANGPLHLGHIAGAYLPADIFVRYKRACGDDTVFVCGADEHGVPITIKAEKQGITPQELVDQNYQILKDGFAGLQIDFSIFSRTTSDVHKETAQDFFTKLYDAGIFEEKITEQFYDKKNDQFLADRYITGTCPKCQYEKAYGDQCERCGSTLSSHELINPKSAISGETPEMKETKHWYLPLDKFQAKLEQYILSDHPEWKKNVLGQCKSWLDQGLQARAVTRDLSWGVPVPIEDAEGKVLYVWFDAPIGYISMTKEWAASIGKPEAWKDYWKNDDSELIHFIGKDNIVFHSIIFPAMLMAYGDGFVLPNNVPANEFLNLEGEKLSTSRNYAVWVHEYLNGFEADSLRYYLATILPELKDSDFSWKQFQSAHNSELADIIGNFVNRTFTFVHNYFEGRVPEPSTNNELDELALRNIAEICGNVGFYLDRFENKKALDTAMEFARFCNKYFNDQEPWKSRKSNIEQCANTLHISLQLISALATVLYPFIPATSEKILSMLNLPKVTAWEVEQLKPTTRLGKTTLLFTKIEDSKINEQLEKLAQVTTEKDLSTETTYKPLAPEILIDDFAKVDLRLGTIISAEAVPKTKKLLVLQIDLGFEKRQIVSGIAEHFSTEDLIGKQVSVIANLKPVKLRGVESQGMILAVEDSSGKLELLTTSSTISNGSKIS
jgi:methionyl-tRNA synthetase